MVSAGWREDVLMNIKDLFIVAAFAAANRSAASGGAVRRYWCRNAAGDPHTAGAVVKFRSRRTAVWIRMHRSTIIPHLIGVIKYPKEN